MRVLSGIQATGAKHIGNYIGAMRQYVATQEQGDAYFCIVDLHSITVDYDPDDLRARTLDLAALLFAVGLDPDRCTLFLQSAVPAHPEAAWLLSAVTSYGQLGRMTQFKDKGEGRDFVSAGLFTYPVLMSADILLYKAQVVPVGDDQVQHLELARETVRRFNHRFGEIFPEPQPRLSTAPRIMGLDGDAKMSKSKNNSIGVFDPPDVFWNKLRTAYTDPQRLRKTDPGRPEICNIYTMHKAMSPEETQKEVYAKCTGGQWGCVECKKVLFDNFEKELVPLRTKREALDDATVKKALHTGAEKAREIAKSTIREVRSAMGLGVR